MSNNIEKNIEIVENKTLELAQRVQRVFEHLEEAIKATGGLSPFKEDVIYIIKELVERQIPKEELTATEIVMKNAQSRMQKAKEEHLEKELSIKDKMIQEMGIDIFSFYNSSDEHYGTYKNKEEVIEEYRKEAEKNA